MHDKRKLVLYIAVSLDGYIAKPNNDLSFLSVVERDGEDYDYNNFISTVDTVIIGRKTYDWVTEQFEFPHSNKNTFVITRTPRPANGKVCFYTGNLTQLINTLKQQNGKTIFCDGGAEIVNELVKNKLMDEFIISFIPILVGSGIKLFNDGRPEQELDLLDVKNFESGLVQLHYAVKKQS
jgi:dihydrofolate reductase